MQGLPVVYYGAVHVDPAKIPEVEEASSTIPDSDGDESGRCAEAHSGSRRSGCAGDPFPGAVCDSAGVIILVSSVAGTRYRRIREVAILKTLGAHQERITRIFSVEFSILGAVAGLVGGILANVFTRIIADKFIEASFRLRLAVAARCNRWHGAAGKRGRMAGQRANPGPAAARSACAANKTGHKRNEQPPKLNVSA